MPKDRGKTVIYSTHDLQMALSQSDKIWLMSEGKLEEGAPEDLMLGGSLGALFESPEVHFNPVDGTFSVRRENMGGQVKQLNVQVFPLPGIWVIHM